MERFERMHIERSYQCVRGEKWVSHGIKRRGGGMMRWQPWCMKKRLFRLWKGPRKCKCQERCRCKKRCRCENCKCRKKTCVLGNPQDVNADLESMKENYNRAKRAAKLAIFNAKNAERRKFCEELEDVDRKGNVFRVAK